MFENYLAGLRGGLAAGVVACLLLAYGVRSGRRDVLRPVRAGTGSGAALVLGLGWAFTFGPAELTPRARETLGGMAAVAVVALLTWAGLRARRPARHAGAVLAAAAFLSVVREGLDTALFVGASVRASLDGSHGPLLVVLLGLLTALVPVLLLYRGAVRVRSAQLLPRVGVLSVLVVAGVLAHGVFRLQEGDVLGGPRGTAFDVGTLVPPDSWYGAFLAGALGFRPDPTTVQVAVWLLYAVPVLILLVRRWRRGEQQFRNKDDRTASGSNSRAYDRRSSVDRHPRIPPCEPPDSGRALPR
ncbi:FTR1 family iron permease [Streptomyces venezuelae]|uniref:Iron transporter n=1 Tax=Streptomyces venezuelae TaxID=54571 RepID=A0A5P2B9Y5_STRVZ|nr:FTR1 family protein [Streptomyces venezuelae]QES26847.1 iron transporter [Streptomyces venezuelae]